MGDNILRSNILVAVIVDDHAILCKYLSMYVMKGLSVSTHCFVVCFLSQTVPYFYISILGSQREKIWYESIQDELGCQINT